MHTPVQHILKFVFPTKLAIFSYLILSLCLPGVAHAQCTAPQAEMGVIIFNKAHKVMQYCNGEAWVGLWGAGGSNLPACNEGEFVQWQNDNWVCHELAQPPVCSGDNLALQWDGTSWDCVTLNSGPDLVNEEHSSEQCTAAGGTVVTTGGGKLCRFDGAACPADWVRFLNWGTYTARTCTGGGPCPHSCTAAGRAWDNAPAPACSYHSSSGQTWTGACSHSGTTTCAANTTQVGCY